MYLSLSSPTTVRLLAAVESGESIRRSARVAGIVPAVGNRLLRDRYLQLRRGGFGPDSGVAEMGIRSSKVAEWEAEVAHVRVRHHRAHPAAVEQGFWAEFDAGRPYAAASRVAGIPHVTGGRWIQRRFDQLGTDRVSVAECARRLRLRPNRAAGYEAERLAVLRARKSDAAAAQRAALNRYWQLTRDG